MPSTNLNLPYIAPSQAQKHVTHNEALRALDALVHISVETASLSIAPSTPVEGSRYIVAATPSGSWAGQQNAIAAWQDGGWQFYAPNAGFIAHLRTNGGFLVFDGAFWLPWATNLLQGLTLMGINATADSTNRLSVKSDAVLFDHNGSSARVKLNKAASPQTASLLFQNAYSGRAEIGLQGDDSFRLKVTTDGTNWRDALTADPATGLIKTGGVDLSTANLVNLLPDSGRFSGNASNNSYLGVSFSAPSYLAPQSGTVISAKGKSIYDSIDYGGAAAALDPTVKALLDSIRASNGRRYGIEWFVARIVAGTSVSETVLINSVTYGLAFQNIFASLPRRFTVAYYVRAVTDNLVIAANHGLAVRTFIDGNLVTVASVITPADGWKHICIHGTPNPHFFSYRVFQLLMPVAGEALLAMPSIVFGHADIPLDTGVMMNSKLFG